MNLRFRIGPFTFGRSGVRLSLWHSGSGISIPLSGKGRQFSRLRLGPFSLYSSKTSSVNKSYKYQTTNTSSETITADIIKSDRQFINNLQKYGAPWRSIQEHIKKNLPISVSDRDNVAYTLVPKMMNEIFGQQNQAWTTEKRPSKSGNGYTTWIVII